MNKYINYFTLFFWTVWHYAYTWTSDLYLNCTNWWKWKKNHNQRKIISDYYY